MLKHFDHVTVPVTDPAAAIGFRHEGITVEPAAWKQPS
jgi:hypothetical protein